MKVDCVFFDAGNTLIYPEPSVAEAYALAVRKRGVEADTQEVAGLFRHAWVELRRRHSGKGPPYGATEKEARIWWQKVVELTFEQYAGLFDMQAIFEDLWNHFADPGSWRVYPDVFPALQALREGGLRIGLISNWDSRLNALLRGLGVWQFLDCATISYEVGAEKPDRRIFRKAISRCGVLPDRSVLVGDSYEEDVLGARAAGLKAMWLRREGDSRPVPEDVNVITGLNELTRLLGL